MIVSASSSLASVFVVGVVVVVVVVGKYTKPPLPHPSPPKNSLINESRLSVGLAPSQPSHEHIESEEKEAKFKLARGPGHASLVGLSVVYSARVNW